MLKVDSIFASFGPKVVLNGTTFNLEEGTLAGLIGPSGAGKSVLLKIIGGVSRPKAGTVVRPGQEVLHDQNAKDVSLMFQEGALFDSLSVYDNVAFPLVGGQVPTYGLRQEIREEVRDKVSYILARVGLTKAANKMPGQLSGGMRKRAALARALVAKPRLLLLDDPTSGLDPIASSVIMNLIVELHAEYKPTTLIVSHDLRRLLPVVQRIVGIFSGKVIFNGDLPELCNQPPGLLREFVSCRFDLNGKEIKPSPLQPAIII